MYKILISDYNIMSHIIVNNDGVNEYVPITSGITGLTKVPRSFAYFTFQDNVVETVLTEDVWTQFAEPTGGLVKIIDNNNDFEVLSGELALKYVGTTQKIFNLSAVTNIFKSAGGGATRTLELQWKLNGEFVGFKRQVQNNTEANIYTGNGMISLEENDVLSPWVRNIENGDDCLLNNASFTLSEEMMEYYK